MCETDGQYANHSCSPNARLVEIEVKRQWLVFIAALRPIKDGEEIYIDYEWYTGRPGSSRTIECLCGSIDYHKAI